MPPDHVHIITAGENIHTAYPAAFRILPTITKTYILVDSANHEKSPNPEIEKSRLAVTNAVSTVKQIALSLSIPFAYHIIFPPTYLSVRDTLVKIHRENPGARYTFDITGGSKPLCTAALAMAPWLDGEVYSSFDEKTVRNVPLPDRSLEALMANTNYQTILAILIRMRNRERNTPAEWVPRQYIFQQLWPGYTRTRTRTPKPDDPVVVYKRGRKPAGNLSHATFSGFMKKIRDAGLATEKTAPGNGKEKVYRVTDHGETAFRFFADPRTSSLIQSLLEKP